MWPSPPPPPPPHKSEERSFQEQADELVSAQRSDRFAEQRIQEAACMLSVQPSARSSTLSSLVYPAHARTRCRLIGCCHEALSDQQRLLNSRARRKRTQTMDFRQSAPCQHCSRLVAMQPNSLPFYNLKPRCVILHRIQCETMWLVNLPRWNSFVN